jgi:hypothetical protein
MNRRRACCVLVLFSLLAWQAPALADKFSDSYLSLSISGDRIDGQWDIALRDLEAAVGLDRDGNGEITWDEVRSRHDAIAAYALSRLTLSIDGRPCPARARRQLVDQHSDGIYSVLQFGAMCPAPVHELTVRYDLLFDIDPQHKGLLKLSGQGAGFSTVFSPDHREQRFSIGRVGQGRQFLTYMQAGIEHIWSGFDHLLFLFSLLLPAVLMHTGKGWRASDSFAASALDVLKIVTAFTLAHSMTLSLAALHVLSLPSRLVESGIALSVIIAAMNNLLPLLGEHRWMAAFLFGLIHGFGFASVLTDLGLPRESLLLTLVGFNLGVEIGQLAVVSAFLPAAYLLRCTWFYQRLMLISGSLLIIVLATIWLVERAFDIPIISG